MGHMGSGAYGEGGKSTGMPGIDPRVLGGDVQAPSMDAGSNGRGAGKVVDQCEVDGKWSGGGKDGARTGISGSGSTMGGKWCRSILEPGGSDKHGS